MFELQGISFKDFKDFCQFLNSLDDFAIAMRMYTYADKPISEGEGTTAALLTTTFFNNKPVHDKLRRDVFLTS